ncbi:MAG: putative ABC exporter domain-containing protein [Candidatus Baltobacteraceae bacterium]
MAGLDALWFLERRQIVNRVKTILTSTSRTVFYVLIAAYFVVMASVRMVRGQLAPRAPHLMEPFASAAAFALLALFAVVAYGAASGFSSTFSSTADARFLTGSTLDARTVVLWLQLRRCTALLARITLSFVFYAMVAARSANLAALAVSALGATAAIAAVSVPCLKLRRTVGMRTAQALPGALAAIALFPMLIVLSGYLRRNATAEGIIRLGAGRFMNALLAGDMRAAGVLWAVCAVLLAAAWLCGDDVYPELYASAMRALSFKQRARGGAGIAFRAPADYQRRDNGRDRITEAFGSLHGPWSLAWKEWIAFARSPSAQRIFVFGVGASALTGWVLGTAAARSSNALEQSFEYLPAVFIMFMVFVAMGSALTLATDLSKPLWWMGPHSLRARLAAWVCATSWRTGLVVFAGAAAWALALHLPLWILFALPASFAAVLYLRAVGLATYSMFPSTIDQRGPMGAVRLLITYALCFPPAIAGVLAGYLAHSIPLGAACAMLSAAGEVCLLVLFAAARIAGSGAAFAQAEAA